MTNSATNSADHSPGDEARVVDAVPTGLFIGGSWRPAAGGRTLTVEDPSTGKA
ncbi:MAG: succinate-semialdehyde dehydrogenase / glutarate-semialdehyde dehydrogenase, partial [Pseudonocardiales bacterium]|nr:succinate-semialdehyde dehydrogenase / glutarate-semialdehyde dehydrogenase [Pseudonocardiales bacterium]